MELTGSEMEKRAICSMLQACLSHDRPRVESLTAALLLEQAECSHPAHHQVYGPYVLCGTRFKGWALVKCGICGVRKVDMHAQQPGHCPHKGEVHPVVAADQVYRVCDACDADVAV